jgi:hypothetical protein
MRSFTITRPTPSMLVALLALVMAMAGTGYAAVTISGKSLKKRSVPANRVIPNALGGRQINESKLDPVPAALQAANADKAKTADSATTADTANTAQTAQTAADANKLDGKSSSAFMASKRVLRSSLANDIATGSGAETTASCLANETAVAGGGAWYVNNTLVTVGSGSTIASTLPIVTNGEFTGWRAEGRNDSGATRDFRAWVVCAQP